MMKIAIISGTDRTGTNVAARSHSCGYNILATSSEGLTLALDGAEVGVDVAGPEPLSLNEQPADRMAATGERRRLIAGPHAGYFGAELNDRSLTLGRRANLGKTRFHDWLAHR